MDLTFPLVIDGQAQTPVAFDAGYAKSSGVVKIVSDSQLSFAFAKGTSGYLVERGNAASFSKKPAKTQISLPRGKAFRLEWPVKMLGGPLSVTLYFNQYDKSGRRTAFNTVALEDGNFSGFLARRPDTEFCAFAIRLMGEGSLDFGKLALTALPGDVDLASVIGGGGKVADHLRAGLLKAIDERRYDGAESICALFPPAAVQRQIHWLRILVARNQYEEAALFYEQASNRLKAQPSARGRYLRALTALNRVEDINTVLRTAVAGQEEPAVLAGLFPYMQHLDPATRVAAAAKVISTPAADVNVRVAAAQMLLDSGDVAGAAATAAALEGASPQTRSEIALLRCNVALCKGQTDVAVQHLSQAFTAYGMPPLSLRDKAAPLSVTNVTAQASMLRRLPKTTVIMSCFNAAAGVGAALSSLQAQSHGDLEIIVVDDLSTDSTAAIVERMSAGDPRVRLIRQTVNQGTYVARNTALAQATGEFVLTHDSDDWAPPQKIERLVRYLLVHPQQVGVRGRMIRFAAGSGAHYSNGYARTDFSSFTFRREVALAKAGFYNNVRIGADSEYVYRLQRLFGEGAIGELDELINLMAYLPQSLTTGGLFHIDINTGVFSKLRADYQLGYMRWHEHAKSLFIDFPDQGVLPFPVPPEIVP